MPQSPRKGRCKNCRAMFAKTQPTRKFCSEKCRNQFNNYGKTPQFQMEGRLKAFMKTPAFHALIRREIEKELKARDHAVKSV